MFRTNLPPEGFLRPKNKRKIHTWEIWLKKLEFESFLPIETAKVWRKWVIEYWKRIKCCLNYWKKQSGSFSSIALEKHKCQQDFSLDFVSDINTNSQRNLRSNVTFFIFVCICPLNLCFIICESAFYQKKKMKYRLGIFKGVWKMSQSV